MTVTVTLPELALRSHDAAWDRTRWEQLPEDGNRYEVIDGVLYMTTAPSYFHQWIIRQIVRILFTHIDDAGVGLAGVEQHGDAVGAQVRGREIGFAVGIEIASGDRDRTCADVHVHR